MSSPLIFESSDDESSRPLEAKLPVPSESNKLGLSSDLLVSHHSIQENTEEHKRVERIRTLLMGVPPPPAVTVSQFDACDILQHLRKNYEVLRWLETKARSLEEKEKIEVCINGEWPGIRDQHWFNLSYNRGSVSEELALLTVKYQERYVGNETSSSVNSFFSKSPIRTASAKKRARRHPWGHSPGRRLSHLARRRHTFSSANLQQNSTKSQPDKKKMILVERRKSQAVRKGRNSATKASGSTKSQKPPSTVNTKRALFQSPENDKNSSLSSDKRKMSRTDSIQRSKRALWPDKPEIDKENGEFNFNSTGKRPAESSSNAAVKKKCLRSLSFTEEHTSSGDFSGMPVLVAEDLSQLHKKKLLWAVSNALRTEGIGMEHSLSKLCMSELFRICKELWLKKHINEEKSGSTSDRMLELAKKFSSDIVRKAKIRFNSFKNSETNLQALSNRKNPNNSVSIGATINRLKEKLDKNTSSVNIVVDKSVQPTCKTGCVNSTSVTCEITSTDTRINSSCSMPQNDLIILSSVKCRNNSDKCDDINMVELGVNNKRTETSNACSSNFRTHSENRNNFIHNGLSSVKYCEGSVCSLNAVVNKKEDIKKEESNCNNLYNGEFSPALSASSIADMSEDKKGLSSCDIDIDKIIDNINIDDECD